MVEKRPRYDPPQAGEPTMHAAQPEAKSIFGKVLAIETAEERAAYLEQACGGNALLREEVESLLAALENAGDFLRRPAVSRAVPTVDEAPVREGPGMVIGPYKLLQQ